ncbi:MAG TPA: endonuclease/exonuclease/phosphatase family protein [Micromonosporaceae bacterium]
MVTSEVDRAPVSRAHSPSWRKRDILLSAIALAMAGLLAGHRLVPNVRGLGSLVDSIAPFLGVGVPVLLVCALVLRSRLVLAATLVPALVWLGLFGVAWLPDGGGGPVDLRVASQNISADNPEPLATVDALVATRADVIALQEVPDEMWNQVAAGLSAQYPFRTAKSTVALWSRYPIRYTVGVDTGLAWTRALRADVATPHGDIVVYVVHLGSARAGDTATRDHTVEVLAEKLRQETASRVILLGDLNTATTDRVMDPLVQLLHDAQADAGRGLGFTWPAPLPITRPDHVLYRGVTAESAEVIQTPGSDHRAVIAGFRLQG